MVKSPAITSPTIASRLESSAIRDLLELTEQPHVLSLAGGLPNPATFPADAVAEATAAALAVDPAGALQYGPTEGLAPLRAWVAQQAGRGAGDPDHVVITSGSQQALDLLARTLVEPGEAVALADPAYVGALQALRAAGAHLEAIPRDHDGLRVDVLADRLAAGLRPALVYVVANFDNPTGATLSAERRSALAALAEHHGFWIVDDDPYGALRWAGAAPPPLRTLTDRVITLGSASKVLAPGLRVGWAVAPPAVARALAIVKQAADLHTGSLAQQVVLRLMTDEGWLDRHLAGLRASYRTQADALADALARRLGDAIAFRRPDGGMFLWAELSDPTADTAALLPQAIDRGVAYVPGGAFAVAAPQPRAMRLSFATSGPAALDEAVHRLAGALGEP